MLLLLDRLMSFEQYINPMVHMQTLKLWISVSLLYMQIIQSLQSLYLAYKIQKYQIKTSLDDYLDCRLKILSFWEP